MSLIETGGSDPQLRVFVYSYIVENGRPPTVAETANLTTGNEPSPDRDHAR